MTCSIIVSNEDTYFYSFMSKERCYLCHSFQREMGHHIWHVGRMRFVSLETNLVFLLLLFFSGGGGAFSLSYSSVPSPLLCEEP